MESLRGELSRTEALRDSAQDTYGSLFERVLFLEGEVSLLGRVSDLFRLLIDQEVVDNAATAQDLITEGLQAVFDDLDLSVRSEVDVQRGKVSVSLVTVEKTDSGVVTEGLATDSYGGSVATVESVLLRIVVLTRRGLRPLLLLDESLGAVAEQYVPRVGQFLRQLSSRLGLDILAVSHNPVLVESCDKAYRIKKQNGAATFVEIRKSQ